MKAIIKAISYYLPETILDNHQLSLEHPEWAADKISQKTGIYKRHLAAHNESAGDMAEKAGKKLLNETKIEVSEIDFLLFCTQSPDYFLPTTACILQNKLGLSTSCGALDFNLGCSGYIYGLALSKALINATIAKKVLLLTSETYSKFINPKDKSNKTIFGDAATATLITSEDGLYEIGNFSLGTDGSGAENLIVKFGALRYKTNKGIDILTSDGEFEKNESDLFMNGQAIFSFTSNTVPKLVDNVLESNNLKQDEIDFFLFHQANQYMLEFIRKKINIPQEKFIYYLDSVGNTVSNTIPIALKEECIGKKKGKILLAGFGVGYSWGGCVIKSN
ncbi:MAG: ketoacyl-ACP synthase III [Bacteroidales bacterium]|nr:ketoacyl-ACP synthase III [Bacteroidales bacterium]